MIDWLLFRWRGPATVTVEVLIFGNLDHPLHPAQKWFNFLELAEIMDRQLKPDWNDPEINPKLADFCRYYGITPNVADWVPFY